MAPHPLTEADPAALGIAYLSTHPDVLAALGGARVGGTNRPPYPRLAVTDPPGSDGDLTWRTSPLLQVEALGDLDGTPGKEALRRILYAALGALAQWPQAVFGPEDPVVTYVASSGGGGWMPLPTGQPRYLATVRLTLHPPTHR